MFTTCSVCHCIHQTVLKLAGRGQRGKKEGKVVKSRQKEGHEQEKRGKHWVKKKTKEVDVQSREQRGGVEKSHMDVWPVTLQPEIVQIKGHRWMNGAMNEKVKTEHKFKMRGYDEVWCELSARGFRALCALTCHFSGLWGAVATIIDGNALHGAGGVWATTLVLGALRVGVASLQIVCVWAAPGAIEGRDAGAGCRPGAEPGHTGTGHWG